MNIKWFYNNILYNFSINEFDIPTDIKNKWSVDFIPLFKKYYIDKTSLKSTELIEFKEIITVIELSELYLMTKPVIEEMYKSQKIVRINIITYRYY